MDRECDYCRGPIVTARAGARFCCTTHRVYWHRDRKVPKRMTRLRRWVRHDADKRPRCAWGGAASSTDPNTWALHGEALESTEGVGLGFVLAGDGIGCYDLDDVLVDGVLVPAAREFLAEHPGWLVETSPSGRGIHIWVDADPQPGWNRVIDDLRVEFYTRDRYITVTGNKYRG